ncbi:MAG TPA: zinc ribbon domain-containing protein [Pyrinomonadaceae bacterium]
MFCPSCGSEERQASQYCRACGTDLRPVRIGLERPDSVTASAVSAREDIGRAVAERIREVEDAHELKRIADHVLPQIEKFLESHEEKRLRRMRAGVIVAASGLGAAGLGLMMFGVFRLADIEASVAVMGMGVIAFAIGVGLVLNGVLFTQPRNNATEALSQNLLDAGYATPQLRPGEAATLKAGATSNLTRASGASITEHTTKHLNAEG